MTASPLRYSPVAGQAALTAGAFTGLQGIAGESRIAQGVLDGNAVPCPAVSVVPSGREAA